MDVQGTDDRSACIVCKKSAKYTCPRCLSPYCSVACFQSHSSMCVARFRRNAADDEREQLKGMKYEPTAREKEEILQILKNDQEQREVDAEIVSALASGSDDDESSSDTEFHLESLSLEERSAFLRAVEDGSIGSLIPVWNPWWTDSVAKPRIPKVTEVGVSVVGHVPPLEWKDSLEPVSSLTSRRPDSTILYHIMESLFSFVSVARLYNGDWLSCPDEAAAALLSFSSVLSGPDARYATVSEVVMSVMTNLGSSPLMSVFAVVARFDDVVLLLRSRSLIQAALLSICELLEACTEAKGKHRRARALKKARFFASFCLESSEDLWSIVRADLSITLDVHKQDLELRQCDESVRRTIRLQMGKASIPLIQPD